MRTTDKNEEIIYDLSIDVYRPQDDFSAPQKRSLDSPSRQLITTEIVCDV
jgi:hypothetical protein